MVRIVSFVPVGVEIRSRRKIGTSLIGLMIVRGRAFQIKNFLFPKADTVAAVKGNRIRSTA